MNQSVKAAFFNATMIFAGGSAIAQDAETKLTTLEQKPSFMVRDEFSGMSYGLISSTTDLQKNVKSEWVLYDSISGIACEFKAFKAYNSLAAEVDNEGAVCDLRDDIPKAWDHPASEPLVIPPKSAFFFDPVLKDDVIIERLFYSNGTNGTLLQRRWEGAAVCVDLVTGAVNNGDEKISHFSSSCLTPKTPPEHLINLERYLNLSRA